MNILKAAVILILGAMIGAVSATRYTKLSAKIYYIEPIQKVLIEDWMGMLDDYDIDELIQEGE